MIHAIHDFNILHLGNAANLEIKRFLDTYPVSSKREQFLIDYARAHPAKFQSSRGIVLLSRLANRQLKQVLVVMQGEPGTGKSYTAKQIAARLKNCVTYSTDEYFAKNGVHCFDGARLGEYHAANLERSTHAMRNGKSVICDNTNITRWSAYPYVKVACELGIPVAYVRCMGNYENVHGVPKPTIEFMRTKIEHLETELVLRAGRRREDFDTFIQTVQRQFAFAQRFQATNGYGIDIGNRRFAYFKGWDLTTPDNLDAQLKETSLRPSSVDEVIRQCHERSF